MYALVDPKSFWPQIPSMSTLPTNQIYMTPVPVTPTYLIGGAPTQVLSMTTNQTHATALAATTPAQTPATPMYYSFQPNWSHHHQKQPYVSSMTPSTRQRMPSDDVFIVDNPISHTPATSLLIPSKNKNCTIRPRRRQRMVGATDEDDVISMESISAPTVKRRERPRSISCTTSSDSSGSEFSPQRSSGSSCTRQSSISPKSVTTNNGNHESMNQSTSSESHKEATSIEINDYSLFNIFSASLYSALNRDPPEPYSSSKDPENNVVIPLKTSSPIPDEKKGSNQIQMVSQIDNVKTKRNKTMKHDSLHQCNDNSEHTGDEGTQEDGNGNRRQKFLRALEEERERQRCLVLPRHAPKMTCKFCKNNGESAEVYSKHRLHYKEKTVCPLLRMYVCRLCNSTGDFAHTIRHCPFNSRFDKVAWKATFL